MKGILKNPIFSVFREMQSWWSNKAGDLSTDLFSAFYEYFTKPFPIM